MRHIMADRDWLDFVAALGLGAVAGAAVALLVRPAPRSRKARLLKRARPYQKRVRRSAKRLGHSLSESRDASALFAEELVAVGRSVAEELRQELRNLLREAKTELARTVQDQTERTRAGIGRRAKH